MATVLLNDDVIRETVVCYDTFSKQVGLSIVHHKISAVVGGITDQDVADARAQSHATPYKAWLSQRSAYRGVKIQLIKPTLRPYVFSNNGAGAGYTGQNQTPTQVSGLIRFRTGAEFTGIAPGLRKYNPRGRAYIPFPSNDWVNPEGGQTLPAGVALAAVGATFPLTTAIVGTGFSATLTMGLLATPAKTFTAYTESSISALWATQRRRGDFGRLNNDPLAP